MVRKHHIEASLRRRPNPAIQGEVAGFGIQKNRLNLKETSFYAFDVYDMKEQNFLNYDIKRWEQMAMETERIVVYADPDLADDIPWYMGQVREYIEAIGAALEKDDFETIRDASHRMRGSGQSFGFDAVSEIGKSIEMAANGKNSDDIRNQVRNLSEYLDRVEVVYEEADS